MHPAITTFVTLMVSPSSLWVDESSQDCLQQIVAKFFSSNTHVLMGDIDFPQRISHQTPVYISSATIPEYLQFDVILVYRTLSEWPGKQLRGRVVFITQSLEKVNTLWTRFRIFNLVVILQKSSECEIYVWFPFAPQNCRSDPVLELIDIWRDGQFLNKTVFTPNPLPTTFGNCPLRCAVALCPPFAVRGVKGPGGPEPSILADLLYSVKLQIQLVRIPDYREYFTEPTLDGVIHNQSVYHMLTAGDTELATTCLVKTIANSMFDSLPSHLTDYGSWFLPGPIPIAMRFGFVQALPPEMWAAIAGSFLASLIFLFIVVRSRSFGFIFSWTTSRLLTLPYPDLNSRLSLKIFSIVLELSVLVISTTYRSLLLLNLFVTPVFRIQSAQEGADYGLKAMIRTVDWLYINQSNHKFWNQILKPGKFEKSLLFDYQQVFLNKTAMLLGRRIVDRAMIHDKHPEVYFEEQIFVNKEIFRTVNLVYLLRPYHPLTPMLTEKMLNIIESGFPKYYIQRAFNSFPHTFPPQSEEEDKALKLPQLYTLFYFLFVLLIICVAVFLLEVCHSLVCKSKKVALRRDRRPNHRLRTLDDF